MKLVRSTCFAVLLAATPAWADDPAKAGKHFTAALAAESRGDWRSALAEYEQAYALAPHPSVLFNLAHVHEKLAAYRRAAELLRQYLSESPDAEDRAAVEQRITDMHDRSSRLRVVSTAGAQLFVDDVARGATPIEIEVAAGEHSAHVTIGDTSSEPEAFTVEYGEPRELTLGVTLPNAVTVGHPPPLTIGIVTALGVHPAIGTVWNTSFPISLSGRLRVAYDLGSRLRLFGELGGTVGPTIEDDSVGIDSGPKERFVVLASRAGAALSFVRQPTWRFSAFGAVGAVIGYHSLSFMMDTVVARQSVRGFGGGAGLELEFASQAAPNQHWVISVAGLVMPTDVGTDTGFRSTGTVNLGGLEFGIGWVGALGGSR